jgi:23S rRNA (pseudouridine1915-N3)-methyltransferase
VKLHAVWIGRTKEAAIASLTQEYARRIARYNALECSELSNEGAVRKLLEKSGRTAPFLVVFDSRGKQMSSEQLAGFVGERLAGGTQELIFAIGPSDGWTPELLQAARQKISFGPITLPHELARVVMLEQLYRAFTILNHHPYHGGH